MLPETGDMAFCRSPGTTTTTLLGTHPSGSVTTARKTIVVCVVPDIGDAASGETESW